MRRNCWLAGLGILGLTIGFVALQADSAAGGKKEAKKEAKKEGKKEGKEPEKTAPASADTIAADQIAGAFRVAAYGRKNDDPAALLIAARVIAGVEFKPVKGEKLETSAKEEAMKLVKEAEGMAGKDDAAFAALLKTTVKIINEGSRGRLGGPHVKGPIRVAPRGRSEGIFTFVGHCELTVRNETRADLDIYVYDGGGRLVAQDRRTDDDCRVSWFAPVAGNYRVVVHNYSSDRQGIFTFFTN